MKYLAFVLSIAFSLSALAAPTGRYKAIVDDLNALHAQYPSITEIFSIGTNDDGEDILGIRISTTPKMVDAKKIGQLVVSTHHGNELQAPVFTMAFLRDLLNRYSSSELYRGNLADMEFHIVPVLNISGYNANTRHEHGRDPNREYDGPCNTGPYKLKSIRQIVAYMKTRVFTGSVTVHGYHGSITHPWGVYTSDYKTLDHNAYTKIFQKAVQYNGYTYGTASDIVYPANGCYEDFVYWKHGMWSLLLELEDGSPNDIKTTVPAIASFFDQLEATPSVKNQHLGQCDKNPGRSLRFE